MMGLALGAAPRPVWAEPSTGDFAQARELLNQGLVLREAGDARAALDKMQAANALAHTPITALELGRTYAALGQLVEAREVLLSVARLGERAEETDRSKAARVESDRLAEELRSRIPTVTLRVRGVAAESAAVTLDGKLLPSEALHGPRLVDPGHHIVTARAPSGAVVDAELELAEGETRSIDLDLPGGESLAGRTAVARSAPTAPPAAERTSTSSRPTPGAGLPAPSRSRTLEVSLVGSGSALVVAGTALMVLEAAQGSAASNRHDRPTYDAAKVGWGLGLAADVVGGALAVSGTLLFLRPVRPVSGSPVSLTLRASLTHWRIECAW
jgi:hypothetical protein